MGKPDYKIHAEEGKLYASITLRDVIENTSLDLEDMPFLAEYKRLYDENDELRELLGFALDYISGGEEGCKRCPILGDCESLPRCTFPDWFNGRLRDLGIRR